MTRWIELLKLSMACMAATCWPAAQAQSAGSDPFHQGGCWEKVDANALLKQHSGKILWRMDGNTWLDAHAPGTNPRRHTFVQYTVDKKMIFAAFRDDKPLSMSPTKACLWFHNDSEIGTVSNPQPGKLGANPDVFKEFPRDAALKSCVGWRRKHREILADQQSDFAGTMMNGHQMDRMSAMMKSPAEQELARQKREREIAQADRDGDMICDRFQEIASKHRASMSHKLVLLMPASRYEPGKAVADKNALLAVFFFDETLFKGKPGGEQTGWAMYMIEAGVGSAFRLGTGYDYVINGDVFQP